MCGGLFSLFQAFFLFACLQQKLNSVSKTDSGMYRCESSNSVGAPKSCVAQQLKVIDCKWPDLLLRDVLRDVAQTITPCSFTSFQIR